MARKRRQRKATTPMDTEKKLPMGSADYRRGNDLCTAKHNDVSWYARNPQILKDAASLSFNNPVGGTIADLWRNPLSTGTDNNFDSRTLGAIPGIMQLHFVSGPGLSKDLTSAVNLAARDIYAFDRKANSGATNYNSPDLMMMLMAMDSIYMMYNYGKRAYGVMFNYEQRSRYLPTALCRACGFSYDDLQANLATLRYWLNMFAGRINTIFTPATLPIVVRHSWMVSNVWKDSDSYKSQLYVYIPDMYYTLEEMKSPGMRLEAHPIPLDLTVAQYIGIMDDMITKVVESEDIGTISGDLIKAYGDGSKFRISTLEESYTVSPVYNESVLNQIHNATFVGTVLTDSCNITYNVNDNCILWKPSAADNFRLRDRRNLLNFPWDDVTPENVMVGSRLTASMETATNAASMYDVKRCGTEFLTVWSIYTHGATTPGTSPVLQAFPGGPLADIIDPGSVGEYLKWVPALMSTQFDWHPLVYVYGQRTDESTSFQEYTNVLGDFNNYTFIDDVVLDKLHTAAVLSEFGVPLNGAI